MRREAEEVEEVEVVAALKRQLEDETLSLEQKMTLLNDGLNSENSSHDTQNCTITTIRLHLKQLF